MDENTRIRVFSTTNYKYIPFVGKTIYNHVGNYIKPYGVSAKEQIEKLKEKNKK